MKWNQSLSDKLQDATRQLLANGPLAATAAIQRALGGQFAAAPAQPAMRDLNPAPSNPVPPVHRTGPSGATAADIVDTKPVGPATGAVDDLGDAMHAAASVDMAADAAHAAAFVDMPADTAHAAASVDVAADTAHAAAFVDVPADTARAAASVDVAADAAHAAAFDDMPADTAHVAASVDVAADTAHAAASVDAAADTVRAAVNAGYDTGAGNAPAPAPETAAAGPQATRGKPGTPPFVSDLLARLGALQSGASVSIPDLAALSRLKPADVDLANINLPNINLEDLNLPNLDLPGMRKVRTPRPLPPGAQFVDGLYQGDTGARHYKLYIPASYRGQPAPLVVMLHGCTQDPDDFAAGTRMNELAEEQGCLVVYPAQSRQANQQRCWNWFNALDQQRGQGEPAIIAGIALQVAAQHAVDPRQVYVAGMSAGGAMAVIAGTLYPDVFAAVGVHSGLPYASAQDLPSALQAMKQGAAAVSTRDAGRPIIVFHGDRDRTVHPRNGEQVIAQQLQRHHGAQVQRDHGSVADGRRYTRTQHRHADGTPLGEHWVVHGAGHAWSGGSADGSYTDARGPDASREMLRFFSTVRA